MPNFISKPLVQNGLVLCLDPAAPKSYGGTGTLVKDLSGQANHGTLTGGVGYNPANMGSFSFDGVDDYVSFTKNPSQAGESRTVEVWFKAASSARLGLVGTRLSSGLKGWGIRVNMNGTKEVSYAHMFTDDSSRSILTPANVFVLGTWCCFAATYNVSTQSCSVYVNGVLVNSETNLAPEAISSAVGGIGNEIQGSATYLMNGNIGPVHLYNRALSAAEVMQNFEAGRTRYGV